MNDFKVGDPVEYVGPNEDIRALSPFIIARLCGSGETRYVKIKGFDRWEPLVRNLRHVTPAPDVITINRADLPEVSAEYEASDFPGKDVPRIALAVLLEAGWGSEDDAVRNLRSVIAGYEESIAGFTRGRRRDELAAELAPRAYASLGANWYGNVGEPLQKAIDRIIELENKAHD